MEPVYCPNGHANRPGTRICAVCRALIVSTPPPSRPLASPGKAEEPARAATTAAPRRSGLLFWLLALLLLLAALAVALLLYFLPQRRAQYLATAAVITLPADSAVAGAPPTATIAPLTTTTAPPTPSVLPPASPTAGADASPSAVATITPLSTIVGIVLTPTLATTDATPIAILNLIQNGDFAADWVVGWERTTGGLNGVQVVETRQLSGDPPRPSLAMSKSGAGEVRLTQHIALSEPAAGLTFRGQLRLVGTAGVGVEGRGALMLLYEDAAGQPLGASVWLDGSNSASALWGGALPAFGPTTAPRIQAADWQTIDIDLQREFTDRLPGLDPAAVRRITVILALIGSDACPPDGCAAELSAAGLSLSPTGPAP